MTFTVRERPLPHDGIIPGARGHKKEIVPKGTSVWVIMYERVYFWACYQTEASAQRCAKALDESVTGKAHRTIDLSSMLAWNFKREFPTRVHREGVKR